MAIPKPIWPIITFFVVLDILRRKFCYAFQNSYSCSCRPQHISCPSQTALLSNAVEDEDTTFFFRASQEAAKKRYERLSSGEDPFGLFRDSAAVDEVTAKLLPMSQSTPEPSIFSDDTGSELLPRVIMPEGYNFQKRLMETRFAMQTNKNMTSSKPETAETAEMQRKARVDAAKDASKSTQAASNYGSISTSPQTIATPAVEKRKGPGCIRIEERPSTDKITFRNRDEFLRSLHPEKKNEVLETIMEAAVMLSSSEEETEVATEKAQDGTSAFPQADTMDANTETCGSGVNEENVAMGLFVLTRSFFTLKHIVDNKQEQS